MESATIPKTPLLSKPHSPSFPKTRCSLGSSFPKIPLRPFSVSLSTGPLSHNPYSSASHPSRFASISTSVGGGGGDILAGGGGGGGGGDGGESETRSGLELRDEACETRADVIILSVKGMTCGGCAASVKRILESEPFVSSAVVNLKEGTASIYPSLEAKVKDDWQSELAEKLADLLTNSGFKSQLLFWQTYGRVSKESFQKLDPESE